MNHRQSKSKYEFDEMMLLIENDSPLQSVHKKNSSAFKNLDLCEILNDETEQFNYSAKSLSETQSKTQI
ncbi:unnamed protein product [Paramecium primaurelia]|uniref:Uncharacterized protein n=1 Tax=Paramecium primaurelia TaxID=5886 RepID=A0A8S1MMG8_PARPR|nr:unnamed protein product [Paramecium primaurelia]